MTSRLVALSIDADDPGRLARFWAAALRWDVGEVNDGATTVVPTDGTRFHVVVRPATGPKVGRNRIHLDLTTTSLDDQRDSVDGLLELGARHLDIGQRPDEEHVVLADPEGNPLCIIEPGNTFLPGCGRLGSITCDGTQGVGYFWSAALGWPLVWDQDEKTAIRAPAGDGPMITWGGPPVAPRLGRDPLRLELAPDGGTDVPREARRLMDLGATDLERGRDASIGIVLADPDGNEFRLRDRP